MIVSITSEPTIPGLRSMAVPDDAWTELPFCPLCGNARGVRDVASVNGRRRAAVFSVCVECEFGFLRRRPERTWFEDFYRNNWDESGRVRANTRQVNSLARDRVYRFCSDQLEQGARVLDVGAGMGRDLLAFREHGFRVQGIERSEHRAKYVHKELGIPCQCASLEDVDLKGGLDLVFSNHVLEHVDNPLEAMRRQSQLLGPRGKLYVGVPNFWQEYPPQGLHFVPHLSWFTSRSLELLFRQCGLEVVKIAVGREIQVLAKKVGESKNATTTTEVDFYKKAADFVCDSFGHGHGMHILVWTRSRGDSVSYETLTLGAVNGRLPLVHATQLIRRCLPGRVSRAILPPALDHPRSLCVRVKGDLEAPIEIQHEFDETTVWIK